MALSGSDLAYLPARSGIARAGAVRAGWFGQHAGVDTWNVVTTIGGANRSTAILAGSMNIHLVLNDEPDTASFTMKPGFTIPTVGQTVTIGLGTSGNLIFGGQIARVHHERRRGNETPWVQVECVDWLRLFDRQVVNRIYRGSIGGSTIDAIVKNVIALDTSGFTSANNVVASAVVPDLFIIEDETPSQILTRLVALNGGGGWYIDPDRDVHFFGTAGETGQHAPTAPLSLTNSRSSLKVFAHGYDASQIRTRVIVKGRSTKTLVTVPNDYTNVQTWGIPVAEGWWLEQSATTTPINLGGQVFTYSQGYDASVQTVVANVSVTANAGDTSVAVTSAASFRTELGSGGKGWATDDSGRVFGFVVHATLNQLDTIPSSGYASIPAQIVSGTQLRLVSILRNTIPADGTTGFDEIPLGETVRLREVQNDTTAQTALAAIEGGDGIHEHIIDAPDDDDLAAAERASAELTAFALQTGLFSAEWETEDLNARPGAQQVISLTVTDAVSGTLTIQSVELWFPRPNGLPRRHCTAQDVKLGDLLALIEHGPYGI